MKTQKYYRRWKRRYASLLKRLPELLRASREPGGAEDIHELRVALRRLRLLAKVGRPCLGHKVERAFHRWSRRVSDSASEVRDLDVTLEWLRRHSATPETMERIYRWRCRAWKMFQARLKMTGVALRKNLRQMTGGSAGRSGLLERHSLLRDGIMEQVGEGVPFFFEFGNSQQHDFRRALRRLSFLRELELPRREQAADARLKLLVTMHQVLGEYQNCQVHERILALAGKDSSMVRLNAELRRDREQWRSRIIRQFPGLKRELRCRGN